MKAVGIGILLVLSTYSIEAMESAQEKQGRFFALLSSKNGSTDMGTQLAILYGLLTCCAHTCFKSDLLPPNQRTFKAKRHSHL
jgi:hypothetical protein